VGGRRGLGPGMRNGWGVKVTREGELKTDKNIKKIIYFLINFIILIF
jgi:hypothetical protein